MQGDGADDLDVLIPNEKTITIGGKEITFKDYSFFTGLKVRSLGKAFIDDMAALFDRQAKISLSDTDALMGKHADVVMKLIAVACEQTEAWVQALNEVEGQQVYNAWWEVNGPFFVRCAVQHLRSEMIQSLVAGLMYGQYSQPMATTLNESAATPTDK